MKEEFEKKWQSFLDFEKAKYNVREFIYLSKYNEDINLIRVEGQYIQLEIKDELTLKHYKQMVQSIEKDRVLIKEVGHIDK